MWSSWVQNYLCRLQILHLALGFRLGLYAEREFLMIYWCVATLAKTACLQFEKKNLSWELSPGFLDVGCYHATRRRCHSAVAPQGPCKKQTMRTRGENLFPLPCQPPQGALADPEPQRVLAALAHS